MPEKIYDVCVVGSGAAGGMAAKILTEGGLEVVMLEAGPLLNPARDYPSTPGRTSRRIGEPA